MAVPVYEGNGGITYRYGTIAATQSIAYPSLVNANDILIALYYRNYLPASNTFNAPSGWTKLYEIATGSTQGELAVFWKRAAGTESGNESFDGSGAISNQANWGVMFRFSGCVTTGSPFDDTDYGGGDNDTVDINAMTASGAGRLAMSLSACFDNTSVNNDATYYSRADQPSDSNSNGIVFPVFTYAPAPGAVSADSFTKPSVSFPRWAQFAALLLPVPGYGHNVIGVASANIGKVKGVATANVSKVIGV